MAAARAALEGMGPSPTMLRSTAGEMDGAVALAGRALVGGTGAVRAAEAEAEAGVWAGGRGAPLGPRAG